MRTPISKIVVCTPIYARSEQKEGHISLALLRCDADPKVHLGSRRFVAGTRISNTSKVPEDRLVRRELELEIGHEGSENNLCKDHDGQNEVA